MSNSNIVKAENNSNLNELKMLAKIAFESKQYAGQSEMSLLNLMLTAHSLGISPLKGINSGFYIVNGKVSMSTTLMADMIRRAGHSIKILEMSNKQCVIIGQRKDNGDSLKFEYTMEDASLAGLLGSPTWKKYPKQMLYNRCMSTVARTLFSDVIGNAYDPDEHQDIKNIPAEKRPLVDPDSEMVTLEMVDTETGEISKPEGLNEDQVNEIKSLIVQVGDEDTEKKLLDYFKVETFKDMTRDQYEKCVKSLEKKVAIMVEAK
jgi:hypothetical protein